MLYPLYKNDKINVDQKVNGDTYVTEEQNLVTSKDEEQWYDFTLNIIKIVWFFKNVST
jgi:hypothetical protein